MFKNHAMQIKMVKDQTSTPAPQMLNIDSDKINFVVRESVKSIGFGIVAVAGSLIAMNTASEILINLAPKK